MHFTHTWSDILFSFSLIQDLYIHYLGIGKVILWYVHWTINYGVIYQHVSDFSFDERKVHEILFSAHVQV